MSIKLRILGGGLEIGKNAIEVIHNDRSLLLDYGASFNGHIDFPLPLSVKKLEGVICSHAHLDHVAGIPLIYSSAIQPKLYTNPITHDLANLLLLDFIKIAKNKLQFDSSALEIMNKKTVFKTLNSEFHVGDFALKTYNAGHIPGSWIILIEVAGRRILYTGDINVYDSRLLNGADLIKEKVDVMLCESTYACINHMDRSEIEKELVARILETLDNGGNVLIPSFSVGRSQEVLCILYKHNVDYPIFLDGMARSASAIMLEYPEYFKDYELLRKALSKIRWINGKKDRKEVLKEPSIIVSPAGMLKGGAATYYVRRIVRDSKSAIFFVGYLSKNTPAREILENGVFVNENVKEKVLAETDWFGLSSHADMKGLISYIEKISPSKVILIHGEPFRMVEMAKESRKMGIDCGIANNGDEIEV